jgi:hypothetical protein
VLSGRGLCDGPIPHPEESYRLWCVSECDQVKINNLDTCCEQVGRRGKDCETKYKNVQLTCRSTCGGSLFYRPLALDISVQNVQPVPSLCFNVWTNAYEARHTIAKIDCQLHHVCPSVRIEQIGSHCKYFQEIWLLFENLSRKFKFH